MEFGHVRGTETGSDLETHQVANPSENSRKSSSSSSSSSAGTEHGEEENNDIPVSSTVPDGGQPSDGSTQPTAERAANRIPSYVFSRDKSSGQMEWSVASNESLFSIHMGTMSFTRDLSWMSKSGELGYTIDSTMSSPLVELPPSSYQMTPGRNSSDIANKSGNLNGPAPGAYGVTEAAAAETMREVLREKESQRNTGNVAKLPHSRSISDPHSDASVKSFAFPILTAGGGDTDKSGSFRPNSKHKKQPSRPSTPKATATPQTPLETPKTQASPAAPETPKPETPKSEMAKETRNAGPKRWFSCFYCCTGTSCS